jgi:hypothetical protein
MSAAAGGITQDFSSRVSISPTIDASFNFDGPYFNNNSMTLLKCHQQQHPAELSGEQPDADH